MGQSNAEQERSSPAASSGKDRAYKAGRLKSHGAGRKSEGSVLPMKARRKACWREGALLWSRRRGGKREGMPETANNLYVKARQLRCPTIGVCQVGAKLVGHGEGRHNQTDNLVNGLIAQALGYHARHIKKIIVKLCAGKPHAQFERGLMETGRR